MKIEREVCVHVAVCLSLAGVPAAGVVAAEADAEETRLETVVVTAERLGLDLQRSAGNGALGSRSLLDTPFSLTVIDSEDIARRQAASVAQIFINDPSVVSSSPSATTNWWGAQIRGLGVFNYYIDGVPLLLNWGGEYPLEAVESVEALKGLAGFMYGFGAPGGVLKYETKSPTDERLIDVNLTYRNDSAVAGNVDLGGRLGANEAFGYRLVAATEQGDAYNTAGFDRYLGSLAVDYRIGDNVTVYAKALYEDSRIKHEPLYFYWDFYDPTTTTLPEPTYDYGNVTVRNSWYDTETLNGSTGLKWRINDDWNADFTAGYSRKLHQSNKMFGYILNEAGDYDGEVYNFAGLLKNRFAQALLQGGVQTGGVRHEVVAGLSYQKATDQWGNDWYWNQDFTGNLYQQQTFVATREPDFSLAPVSLDERQYAVFASDTLHFGQRWQAVLGARYTSFESKDLDGDPDTDSGYSKDPVTPTLALIFKPLEHVSLYGSYVESMEAGSRVGDTYANFGDVLDPTISRQLEFGAKYEQPRFGFTAAAFRVKRVAEIDETRDDGLTYLTQDGLTVYNGIEAIGSFAATPQLRLGLGATWLDADIRKVSEENAALEGNVPAGVADWQVTGNAEYFVPAVRGLSLHGTVRYFGDMYYNNDDALVIPGHTAVNVGFQYRTKWGAQRVVVTGNVNNLLNEKYWELNQLGEGLNGSLGLRLQW